MRAKNYVMLCIAIMMLAVCLCGCGSKKEEKTEASTEAASVNDTGSTEAEAVPVYEQDDSYLHITYDGKDYTYNSGIITVMYAGVDSNSDLETYNRYSIAPRADTIELIIFDDYNKKISILAISRDTITSVARYTMNGNYRDNYDTHLGYAYTYGDGGQASCYNLVEAVRGLLKDVPIHEYVITNNSSIGKLNNIVGGVTVTVPNDDLKEIDSSLTKGSVVALDDATADTFTRWRDTSILYSNNGRIERQKEFSIQFFRKFVEMAENDVDGTWKKIEEFSEKYQTSIGRNQYLDLVDRLKTEEFQENQYYILQGKDEYDENNNVDLFYVDEENLMETILTLFYLED